MGWDAERGRVVVPGAGPRGPPAGAAGPAPGHPGSPEDTFRPGEHARACADDAGQQPRGPRNPFLRGPCMRGARAVRCGGPLPEGSPELGGLAPRFSPQVLSWPSPPGAATPRMGEARPVGPKCQGCWPASRRSRGEAVVHRAEAGPSGVRPCPPRGRLFLSRYHTDKARCGPFGSSPRPRGAG